MSVVKIGALLSFTRVTKASALLRQSCNQMLFTLACLLSLLALPLPACSAEPQLEQQRSQFKAARKALNKGEMDRYRQLAAALEDYPLYPYLRYEFINKNLRSLPEAEIAAFLQKHSDFPMADRLRERWLDLLASRGRWQEFISHYEQPNDNRLRCLYLQARMKTGSTDGLLEDIIRMWRVGYSQDDACDPAFEKLAASSLMTNDLIWERIRLTMANNQTGLASYLAKKLDGAERSLAGQWLDMHKNPAAGTHNPQFSDSARGREIVLYGLKRLASRNIDKALDRWQDIQQHYSFEPDEIAGMQRDLAVEAADEGHPEAGKLLDQVAGSEVDRAVFIYRLRHAINNGDWQKLLAWTDGAPPEDVDMAQWNYWHARALEQTGETEAARDIYHDLATERDFYSFMAADRLGIDYQMNHFPLPISDDELSRIAEIPGLRRAFEFLALGEEYPARREWHHVLKQMTSYEMQGAARLAARRGWHNSAILALGRAKAYDDLELRFPTPHHQSLAEHARKRGLDLAWMYGLIRSESAFWEDARSPAGALGLMQVMPRTGAQTASKIGMKNFNSNQLLKAEYNIPIGSQYLKMMYDDFNGNMILATAAYNAGPHRVKSWLPKTGCIEPDVWIENIPFYETRDYVKRVLSYASIYDWRLEGERKPLSARMAQIQPRVKSGGLLAGLSCDDTSTLSMQP